MKTQHMEHKPLSCIGNQPAKGKKGRGDETNKQEIVRYKMKASSDESDAWRRRSR